MAITENTPTGSTDLDELHSVISSIIGKKCWRVNFTYGGSLSLHLGRQVPYTAPQMRGKKKGQWILGTVGTAWTLFTPHGVVSSKQKDEKKLEAKAKALEGRKVTRVNISVPDTVLTVTFDNDHLFQVTPTRNDARSSLPYWELYMPDHELVTFGPGNAWSHSRSDEFWDGLVRHTGTEIPAQAAHVLQRLAGVDDQKARAESSKKAQ